MIIDSQLYQNNKNEDFLFNVYIICKIHYRIIVRLVGLKKENPYIIGFSLLWRGTEKYFH